MEVDSELATEYVYIQIFAKRLEHEGPLRVTQNDVKIYANDIVNERNFDVFYKALIHSSDDGFSVTFYAFADIEIDAPEIQSLKDKYQHHLDTMTEKGLSLQSESVQELLEGVKRNPVADDVDSRQEESQGCENIPGSNWFAKFINWWLIVPKVQFDFFNLLYQMYTFDITHQGFAPKFVHFFTIPCNVMLSMCFLAQFSITGSSKVGYGAFEVNAAIILLGILVVLYMIMGFLRKTPTWGLATSVVLFVCWVTGNLWYSVYKTPGNPWYNPTDIGTNPIMWSYIISAIQASSHMCMSQLPPYITGVGHWESLHSFFCTKYQRSNRKMTSLCFIVMALLSFPIFSVAVAWFSWPHLIGTEIIYIMAGIGYQHSSFEKYFRVVEKAELSGNPGLDQFPRTDEELTNSNIAKKLKKNGLLKENCTLKDVTKVICSMKLAQEYFKHGVKGRKATDFQYYETGKKAFKLS